MLEGAAPMKLGFAWWRKLKAGDLVTVPHRPHYGVCTLEQMGGTHATVRDSLGIARGPLVWHVVPHVAAKAGGMAVDYRPQQSNRIDFDETRKVRDKKPAPMTGAG